MYYALQARQVPTLVDPCKIGLGLLAWLQAQFLKRDELYDLTEPNEALLHDLRLTVKDNNEKIRKRRRFSITVDVERMSMEIVERSRSKCSIFATFCSCSIHVMDTSGFVGFLPLGHFVAGINMFEQV